MTPSTVQSKILQGALDPSNEEDNRTIVDSLDWKKLGDKCAGYFRQAPTVDFM